MILSHIDIENAVKEGGIVITPYEKSEMITTLRSLSANVEKLRQDVSRLTVNFSVFKWLIGIFIGVASILIAVVIAR